MKIIAFRACLTSAKPVFFLILAGLIAGCSALPEPPPRATVYDFGSGPVPASQIAQVAQVAQDATLPPLILLDMGRNGAPEGSAALHYRLAYANDQQLLPYTHARWSQPPAALLQQSLRERLARQRIVLTGQEAATMQPDKGRLPGVLRVQLEEFSQVFDSPESSAGLVRVRAMLSDAATAGETIVAQQVFVARVPATTADAAGGARALAAASAQLADELADWVRRQGR